jgi:alkaline phosphatase D
VGEGADRGQQGIDRRTFVAGAGIGASALILGGVPLGAGAQRRRRPPFARAGTFPQGVAAGEPGEGAVTLWTRLEGYNADRRLTVEIARDEDFRNVVFRRDNVVARASEEGAVKLRVNRRLKPGERYYYRFETRGAESRVGRFQTLRPPDSREPVRIAFWSCQDYQAGYYGAHDAIAREDVDLVVCLGDYIYERNFYEGPRRDTVGANGDGEVMTLPEYRQKYRLYKSDQDLQAMHASHAFMAIWDDHEVEDNYAAHRPGEAAVNRRGEFEARRRFAHRAYFEHMPFRRTVRPGARFYRSLSLGRNAEVFLPDTRQYRDDQPCGDEFFVPCPEADAPGRTMLGAEQKVWLKQGLEASSASWKVIASQVMIMALDSAPNTPINKDQWDGYGAERRELLQHVADRGIQDVTFMTGDIHTFFAGDVGIDGRGPESVATEFVGGSITSLGIPETVQSVSSEEIPREQVLLITRNLRTTNPHLRYDEQESRGYGLLTASESELSVEFRKVEARQRSTEAIPIGRFRVARGEPRVQVL